MTYMVIRDTREQDGWDFEPSKNCSGTKIDTMKTGDYTLEGFEDVLCIERKGSIAEFAGNIVQNRFEAELVRMEQFKYGFMVLEFDMCHIMNFPQSSTIPREKWPELKLTPFYILKRLVEFQINYKSKIILAGAYGRETAGSIFKRVIETHAREETTGSNRTSVARTRRRVATGNTKPVRQAKSR